MAKKTIGYRYSGPGPLLILSNIDGGDTLIKWDEVTAVDEVLKQGKLTTLVVTDSYEVYVEQSAADILEMVGHYAAEASTLMAMA